jgi:2-C-methyl-D-erythritol 2,4-cyclodiphosphate synthase
MNMTKARPSIWRIGEGWDIHELRPGRRLVLGGVEVPHTHGSTGHSDADAICLRSPTRSSVCRRPRRYRPSFPGQRCFSTAEADSLALLAEAARRVKGAGWQIGNVDATVIAQAPKLAPHILAMRQRLSQALVVALDQVSVKAKTAEGLGPVGQGQAMEARAVCLLWR